MQSDFKSLAHTSESCRGSADRSCYRYRSCLWPVELPAMLSIRGALGRQSAQSAPVQMRAGRQLSSSLHQAVRAPAALRRAAATRQDRHRRGWPAQATAADSTAPSVAAPQPRRPNPTSLSGARRACLVLFCMSLLHQVPFRSCVSSAYLTCVTTALHLVSLTRVCWQSFRSGSGGPSQPSGCGGPWPLWCSAGRQRPAF